MSTSQNDGPVPMEPISNETGLVRRSEFLTNRVRELAQRARALDLTKRPRPKDSNAYYTAGCAHNEEGRYEQAIQDLDEAIKLEQEFSFAYRERAISHDRP